MKAQFEPILFTSNHLFNASMDVKKEFDYPFHYHPELELTLVLSSSGIRYVGNHFEDFKVNDLVLVGPNLPHCWKNNNDNTTDACALVLQWQPNRTGDEWENLIEFEKIRDLQRLALKGIKFDESVALRLKEKMVSIMSLAPFKRMIVFLEILQELATTDQYTVLCEQSFTYNLNHLDNHRINTVYQYVKKHYREKITLKSMATEANMTEESFSRFFSKIMKKGFFTFLNEYRVNNACKLLIETDMQVAEICYNSGYESISFFYRQFKKVKNCSPQHFRASFKQTGDHMIPSLLQTAS